MNKALIVLTSHSSLGNTGRKTGWYLSEAAHPYFQLAAAGIEVDFVSPLGGRAPMDESSRDPDDEENRRFLDDASILSRINQTLTPLQVKVENYIAIIYVGGHGTMWDFSDNRALAGIATKIYENGGVVAAVCHGPAGLINVILSNGKHLVAGKRVAAFTNAEEEENGLASVVPFLLETALRERGAIFQLAPNWAENVVVDGRVVTGQNPQSARKLGTEVAGTCSRLLLAAAP